MTQSDEPGENASSLSTNPPPLPPTEPPPPPSSNILGPAITFGGLGSFIVFIGRLVFHGEAETLVVNTAPFISAVVTYGVRNFGFIVSIPVMGMKRRRTIQEEIYTAEAILSRAVAALEVQRDQPRVPAKRKKEINEDIAELQRLFAEKLKDILK